MTAHELKQRLDEAETVIRELKEDRAKRTTELRAAYGELAATNSELMQLTLELDDRVAQRTNELSRANEGLRWEVLKYQQAEEALTQARQAAEHANRAKDQFISVMSHELRTPLTPVLAVVSAMHSQEEHLSSEVRDNLDVIHRNVELEARLIDDLLDLTRLVHGRVALHHEIVDAHVCLQRVVEMCQSEINAAHLDVTLSLYAKQHCVWADAARLQQVFWNLLKNAIKFTPTHGKICLRSANRGQQLAVQISDTGIGIEAEMLPRIFDSFEQAERTRTRRFGGMGLGLTIAKSMMNLHHGRLIAFSEGKDKGSTFTVELNTIPYPRKPKTTSSISPEGAQAQRILLVDDHADTLRILSCLLKKWGYTVTSADCVQSALDVAGKERFDLLISDLGLPDGSGWDIMRRLKELYGLHGIAVSGFGSDEDIRNSRQAGFEEHLIKPLNFQTLRTAVHRLAAQAA